MEKLLIQEILGYYSKSDSLAEKKFKEKFPTSLRDGNLLHAILSSKLENNDLFQVISFLANMVHMEIFAPGRFEIPFKYAPIWESLYKYMKGYSIFSRKNVPLEEWRDLRDEQLTTLQRLVTQKKLNRYEWDDEAIDLSRKFSKRYEELRNRPEYAHLNELMGN